MPQMWQEKWSEKFLHIEESKKNEEAQRLIYQLGNMTLLKHGANAKLQNESWEAKQRALKNNKSVTLMITKEILGAEDWNAKTIAKRTENLLKDFLEIWDVGVFDSKTALFDL